jgi:hypothetical protein
VTVLLAEALATPAFSRSEPCGCRAWETQNPRSRGMNLGLRVSALGGIRTPNLLIRSQMLYPLSYERVPLGV